MTDSVAGRMTAVIQHAFFDTEKHEGARRYLPILTAVENQKGVLDASRRLGACNSMIEIYLRRVQSGFMPDSE